MNVEIPVEKFVCTADNGPKHFIKVCLLSPQLHTTSHALRVHSLPVFSSLLLFLLLLLLYLILSWGGSIQRSTTGWVPLNLEVFLMKKRELLSLFMWDFGEKIRFTTLCFGSISPGSVTYGIGSSEPRWVFDQKSRAIVAFYVRFWRKSKVYIAVFWVHIVRTRDIRDRFLRT